MTLTTLRAKASKAAKARGHALRWRTDAVIDRVPVMATGTCARCGADVFCNVSPAWPEPSYGGDAIELNCTKDRATHYELPRRTI
jgi:hypothetical protein